MRSFVSVLVALLGLALPVQAGYYDYHVISYPTVVGTHYYTPTYYTAPYYGSSYCPSQAAVAHEQALQAIRQAVLQQYAQQLLAQPQAVQQPQPAPQLTPEEVARLREILKQVQPAPSK